MLKKREINKAVEELKEKILSKNNKKEKIELKKDIIKEDKEEENPFQDKNKFTNSIKLIEASPVTLPTPAPQTPPESQNLENAVASAPVQTPQNQDENAIRRANYDRAYNAPQYSSPRNTSEQFDRELNRLSPTSLRNPLPGKDALPADFRNPYPREPRRQGDEEKYVSFKAAPTREEFTDIVGDRRSRERGKLKADMVDYYSPK